MSNSGVVTVTPGMEESSLSSGVEHAVIAEVREKGEIREYLSLLLRHETELYPPCKDYLEPMKAARAMSDVDLVTEGWRRKLCEWAYEVVDHFNFDREVVSIALDYLDRFASKYANEGDSLVPKKEYQLIAVAAIYMAIKIHGEVDSNDGPRRKLRIDAFYELSRKQFDVDLIEKTERHMLEALNWNVNPPTALRFISTLLSLCPKWQGTVSSHSKVLGGIYDVARYLSELSVCQSDFSFTCKTSLTAYASILCALEASNSCEPLPYQVRVLFLNNIAEATGFVAGDAEVLRLCDMLRKLCPNMFEDSPEAAANAPFHENAAPQEQHRRRMQDGDTPMVAEDRNASPVCVMEEEQQAAAAAESRRKRSRNEDEWLPIGSNTTTNSNDHL